MAAAIQPQWGWGVLVVGMLALAAAFAMRGRSGSADVRYESLALEAGIAAAGAGAAAAVPALAMIVPVAWRAIRADSVDVTASTTFAKQGTQLQVSSRLKIVNAGTTELKHLEGSVEIFDGAGRKVGERVEYVDASVAPGATISILVSGSIRDPDDATDADVARYTGRWETTHTTLAQAK